MSSQEVRRSRQPLLSFLLRHNRATPTRHHWTWAHRNWLARQSFIHQAEQVLFEELIQRIGATRRNTQKKPLPEPTGNRQEAPS